MKKLMLLAALGVVCTIGSAPAKADDATISGSAPASGTNADMKEDKDGNLEQGEYEVISPNGSVTRALCPYTCSMRGLPKSQCVTWKSAQDPTKCYVQDRSIPSQAVPLNPQPPT